MQGYSFETFTCCPGNQAALDACRGIAAFERDPGRPVLLLGPEGSGKSHLLWSMVKRVRVGAEKVGLALIMAHEFPAKVKELARDPGPIASGRKAMLLVDGVQDFREESDALEAVVRVFLRHGHHVALTSDVHPDRLIRLSPQFRALLKLGHIIDIEPPGAVPEVAEPVQPDVAALEAEVSALRAKREELEKRLAATAVSSTEIDSLRGLVRSGLVEQDRLKAALAAAASQAAEGAETAQEEMDALRFERDALKSGLEKAKSKPRDVDAVEMAALREQIEELTAELDRMRGSIETRAQESMARSKELALRLSEAEGESERLQFRIEELVGELAQARDASEARDSEGAAQVEAWETRLSEAAAQSAALRSRAEQATSERDAARAEAASLTERVAALESGAAQSEALEARLAAAREEAAALRTALEAGEAELEAVRAEASQTRGEADAARAESGERAAELETLRAQVVTLTAERDAALEGNRRLAVQAEGVLNQIEETKHAISGGQQGLLASFQQLLYDFHAHGLAAGGVAGRERLEALLGDADNLAEAFQEQMRSDRARFAVELERAQDEGDFAEKLLEETRAEQGRLRVALASAEGRSEALDIELSKARKQLALQVAEMDALRQEAASQVASAHMQAGELEHRLGEIEAALAVAREAGVALTSLGDRLGGFAGFVDELRAITMQYSALRDAGALPLRPGEASKQGQAALFETFDSLPRPRIVTRDEEPKQDGEKPVSLVDLVEEALAPDVDEHRAG